MALQMSSSMVGNRVILKLTGRFDFNDHRIFKAAYEPLFLQPGLNTLEIDLAGIEYLDSSALGMLMLMRERAGVAGKKVELARPGSTIAQILDIANFNKLFTIIK
jgi:anti-anti-sigma factor